MNDALSYDHSYASVIPSGVSGNVRDRLEQYLIRRNEAVSESEPTSDKVSKELCELMNELYEQDVTVQYIMHTLTISSRSTFYYHINSKCSHENRTRLTYDECGWIRYYLEQGASTGALAVLYDTDKANIRKHAKAKCDHDNSLEPVSAETRIENGKVEPKTSTSVCEMCGDEFEHKAYRDRSCCSVKCGTSKAGKVSTGSL